MYTSGKRLAAVELCNRNNKDIVQRFDLQFMFDILYLLLLSEQCSRPLLKHSSAFLAYIISDLVTFSMATDITINTIKQLIGELSLHFLCRRWIKNTFTQIIPDLLEKRWQIMLHRRRNMHFVVKKLDPNDENFGSCTGF